MQIQQKDVIKLVGYHSRGFLLLIYITAIQTQLLTQIWENKMVLESFLSIIVLNKIMKKTTVILY